MNKNIYIIREMYSFLKYFFHNTQQCNLIINYCYLFQSVWPFQGSMGCSEMYNAVLNLSTLQNFSDAVFILENDNLMKLCMQKMGMKEPCVEEFNLVASYQLANLLLPVDNNFSTLSKFVFSDFFIHLKLAYFVQFYTQYILKPKIFFFLRI